MAVLFRTEHRTWPRTNTLIITSRGVFSLLRERQLSSYTSHFYIHATVYREWISGVLIYMNGIFLLTIGIFILFYSYRKQSYEKY